MENITSQDVDVLITEMTRVVSNVLTTLVETYTIEQPDATKDVMVEHMNVLSEYFKTPEAINAVKEKLNIKQLFNND